MKIKKLAAILALSFSAAGAQATLLNFDTFSGSNIPNGYGGLNWNNFFALDGVHHSASGYVNGVVSPNNVIYNAFGNAASFSSPAAFTLNSMYLTAAWNDGLNLTVTGFSNGIQVDSASFVLNTSGPTLETFNWTNVDSVQFVTSGGTKNPAFSTGAGTHIALDNLTINEQTTNVPEPASIALLGLGLVGLMASRRRKTA